MTPELSILLLVFVIIVLLYKVALPQLKVTQLTQVAILDVVACVIALVMVGNKYYGYQLLIFNYPISWWFYTLLCYALVELPFAWVAFKKYQ